jgi:hypothetical protein
MVALPVDAPKHEGSVVEVTAMFGAPVFPTVTVEDVVQPFASVTTTE